MIFLFVLSFLVFSMLFFVVAQLLRMQTVNFSSFFSHSIPRNNQVVEKLPLKVHARFSFPITQESYFRINKDGTPISNGETFFDKDNLGMYYLFHKNLGKGKYNVNYEVFLARNGSEKGSFCFFVD